MWAEESRFTLFQTDWRITPSSSILFVSNHTAFLLVNFFLTALKVSLIYIQKSKQQSKLSYHICVICSFTNQNRCCAFRFHFYKNDLHNLARRGFVIVQTQLFFPAGVNQRTGTNCGVVGGEVLE